MGSPLGLGIVGALAIALAAAGLVASTVRPGPYDLGLERVAVDGTADGTYHAVAGSQSPLCAVDPAPCAASTRVDLRLAGLPDVPYTARLEGPDGVQDLGPLRRDPDGTQALSWSRAEDHSGKRALVIAVAGLPVRTWAVGPSAAPQSLDGPFTAALALPGFDARVAQIGAVEVSAVATARAPFLAPDGWELVAALTGGGGTDLGPFAPDGAESVLDARVERVRLGDHDGLRVLLRPVSGPGTGAFPVSEAPF